MANLSRRTFMKSASAATVAATVTPSFAASRQRVLIGSNKPDGILAYDWDPATASLSPAGVQAKIANVDWVTFSPDRQYVFAASEVDSFHNKPTGEVASFKYVNGSLQPLSGQNSAAKGTCHVAVDHTGRVLISADYGGGGAAAFQITDGELSPAVWTEHYVGHGPQTDRQESAHAHFVSFSPDNHFAYINDLGSDCIHIYRLDVTTPALEPAGKFTSKPGSGPRTLHFHPNGRIAYCLNELAAAVDVLKWNKASGSLTFVARVPLNPDPSKGPNTGCDTVITQDGRHAYFANRGDDSIYSFNVDGGTGGLTPIGKTPSGGKTPRNFVLDPTEKWMLVANQNSDQLSVFARDPKTGALARQGKSFACPAPMCILFA